MSFSQLLVFSLIAAVVVETTRGQGIWSVRYGQHQDQKAEWTGKGYVPSWSLDWRDAEKPEVLWHDHPKGDARGWLLICRPVKVPVTGRARLCLSLEYQTSCALDTVPYRRSGVVQAVAMSVETWESLAKTPEAAAVLDPRHPPGDMMSVLVHGQGDDVAEWRESGTVELGELPRALRGTTIMCGIAWGGWHYGTDEHGGIRNLEITVTTAEDLQWEFWEAFDFSHPGFAAVRAAVEARDETAASQALAAFYRGRERPIPAQLVSPATARTLARADETCEHTYRKAGCPPYTFPDRIVWNHDPFNYNQWPIHLNRHSEWLLLAAAYLKIGDRRYADEWQTQLLDWVAAGPILIAPRWIQGPYNQSGRAPLSLDAGIRMGQTWFKAFEVFRRADCVSDEAIVAFVRSCYQHAAYLMRDQNFKAGSNWGAMEANGLFHIGVLLPEFRAAGDWRNIAIDRTNSELTRQVYPDGAQTELAPGYHGVSLLNFLGVLELAQTNDIELPADFIAQLERMFDYYLRIMMPDGTTPALNDSGRGGVLGWLRRGMELFPERNDFRWVATHGKEGTLPSFTSTAMPYAGWVVMRNGWGADAFYLLFDAGPFGTGHQHEDKLSVILYAYGHQIVAEAGVYAYDTSDWRRYVLSTRAHSTVRIDGLDQACRRTRREWRATKPDTHGFHSTALFDYARDTHTAGYGKSPSRNVVHRRRVLYVKPDCWLIVDDLAGSDDAQHTATSQFLIDAPAAVVDSATGWVVSAGAGPQNVRLLIVPLTGEEMRTEIIVGQREPEVIGFLPQGFEKLRPVPAVQLEMDFRGAGMMAYALIPFKGEELPVKTSVARSGAKRELVFGDGRRVIVQITPTGLEADRGGGRRFVAVEPALEAGLGKPAPQGPAKGAR